MIIYYSSIFIFDLHTFISIQSKLRMCHIMSNHLHPSQFFISTSLKFVKLSHLFTGISAHFLFIYTNHLNKTFLFLSVMESTSTFFYITSYIYSMLAYSFEYFICWTYAFFKSQHFTSYNSVSLTYHVLCKTCLLSLADTFLSHFTLNVSLYTTYLIPIRYDQ